MEDVALRDKHRTWMTTCDWIYGETGTGNSEYAFKDFNPQTHYVVKYDKGWWDGYKGQETIIMDDVRGHIPYDKLLQSIDMHSEKVRSRGKAPTPFLVKHIIITSRLHPNIVFFITIDIKEDSLAQLYK